MLEKYSFSIDYDPIEMHKTIPTQDLPSGLMVTSQIQTEYWSKNVDAVFLHQKVFLTSKN